MVERAALLRRYRELVLDELPSRARAGRWVVVADHCVGRIVLDNTVGGCWYDVLDRRRSPAFTRLDDRQPAAAVELAERIAVEGDPLVALPSGEVPRRRPPRASGVGEPGGGDGDLDARSLAWRGKAPKRPTAPALP